MATIVIALLAGCVSAPAEPESARVPAAPAPTEAPATVELAEVEVDAEECADRQLVLDEDDPNQVAQVRIQTPVDSGPQQYARGEAVLDDSGTPVAYLVAPDDIGEFIAERFCLSTDYLHSINAVRRDASVNLFVGDTLNLDATTILSVGDQNGQVLDHAAPSPIPPQR